MRYERKYRMDRLDRSVAEQVVRLHPASFRKLFPDRTVNNLYLDTPGLEAFQDNVAGTPYRKKFRLRWYNESRNPALEIKKKENQLGDKEVVPLPDFCWDHWREEVRQLAYKKIHCPSLQPVLVNSYNRSYWATPDKRFRITIDWNLRFAWPTPTPNWGLPVWHYRYEGIVLELKYAESLEQDAQAIFQYLPFRQTKSSKYVVGVNLLFG